MSKLRYLMMNRKRTQALNIYMWSVGGLCVSMISQAMLAGNVSFLIGPPKLYRLETRQRKTLHFLFSLFQLSLSFISPFLLPVLNVFLYFPLFQ